jgi:predicted Zn-dependent protease
VDWNDWSRIDAPQLAQIALDKCLRSRNPVRVEPGRYTTILEPQAVSDLLDPLFDVRSPLARIIAEGSGTPFSGLRPPLTKIGQKVLDERITITADPTDPDLGIPPFDILGNVYHPVTWFENGVLKNLAYDRPYAMKKLRLNSSLENSGAFHMTGGTTSIDEMIQTTKRGLLVTRFSGVDVVDAASMLCAGYTRDGLWLIENGKISKPVKNFRFTESPLFVLNQVEQLGVPQRVFHVRHDPYRRGNDMPAFVPPVKVRDFSFTSLADAV